MTITTQPARNEYTANAGQTIFNYTFKIFENGTAVSMAHINKQGVPRYTNPIDFKALYDVLYASEKEN